MRPRLRLAAGMAPLLAAACLALMPASPAAAAPGGNNGTVKIGEEGATGNANDPHVACTFDVRFFNFDPGQSADLVFSAQPPSDHGQELLTLENQVIGNDAGGPIVVTIDGATQLDLTGLTRQQNQGFHVRLDVVSTAGEKHKVFWVDCPPPKPPCPPPPGQISPELIPAPPVGNQPNTRTTLVYSSRTSTPLILPARA
jgi:hypothetical protein